ncbi:hypothetical protein Tco_0980179 [Tanacetum coccineum]
MPWCSTLKTTISLRSCPIALLSIRNICITSTPAIASKMPYFVALVAFLGARAIVVKMALGTDIAKITRKRLKPDNHGHGNGKENTRAGRMLSKSYTSPNAPIGGNPQEECHADARKHTKG